MKNLITRHADLLLFGLLISLWLFESLVLLQSELRFTADSERDLFQVLALTQYGRFPDSGILMAALGWDLGPLYFLMLAPLNAVWPHPMAVHLFNVAVCVGGLIAAYAFIRQQWGTTAALLFALLYSQSAGHVALTNTVWHVGAAPGVALAMFAAAGWWIRSGRATTLAVAGGLLSVLVQIHALGMAFVPAAAALLWVKRRHLNRRALLALVLTVIVVLLPLLVYLLPSLGATGGSAARHGGGLGWDPAAFWEGLIVLTRPNFFLSPVLGGYVVLVLAVAGVAGTVVVIRAQKPLPWFRLFLLAQTAVGAIVVSLVTHYEFVGRYFLPVLYPLFFLVAAGAADVDKFLARHGRGAKGRKLTWLALVLGLMVFAPPQVNAWSVLAGDDLDVSDGGRDYLTLVEQDVVVSYFVIERGMTWSVMRSRVHGSYLGPLSGIRYLETIYRDNRKPQASAVPSGDHWIVIPAGLNSPPIPPDRKEVVTLASPGRKLHLYRYESALDPGRIVGEKGPCPWIFPTMWSEQNTEVLQLVGFADGHGPDVHSCFKDGKQGTLVVALGKNAGHLTVQISDDGHFSNRPDSPISATLHTPGFPPLKLAPSLNTAYAEKRWMAFSFPSHDEARTLHLAIKPRGNLAFIDVF